MTLRTHLPSVRERVAGDIPGMVKMERPFSWLATPAAFSANPFPDRSATYRSHPDLALGKRERDLSATPMGLSASHEVRQSPSPNVCAVCLSISPPSFLYLLPRHSHRPHPFPTPVLSDAPRPRKSVSFRDCSDAPGWPPTSCYREGLLAWIRAVVTC